MKCKCGHENPQGELFCEACGEELKAETKQQEAKPKVSPAKQAADQLLQAVAPKKNGKKIATLVLHKTDEEFDLYEGQTLLIARADTDKCTPDIPIEDTSANPSVSSTPVEVSADSDGITIKTEASAGFRLIQFVEPGVEIKAKIGDILQLGAHLIRIE